MNKNEKEMGIQIAYHMRSRCIDTFSISLPSQKKHGPKPSLGWRNSSLTN